jgi:hypothetical protein
MDVKPLATIVHVADFYLTAGDQRVVDKREIIKLWKQRPFQPFRIYMRNGDVYVLRHAELFMVCPNYVLVGIPIPNHPLLLCDHMEYLSYQEIERLEQLPAPAATAAS